MSTLRHVEAHQERRLLLAGIYDFCRTGSHFEHVCRALLEAMDLRDVVVTGRTGDGGVDLVCTREGVEGLSAVDRVCYRVQAKRRTPGAAVAIQAVRALRGVLVPPEKGIFITTGRFTRSGTDFLEQDPSRPIILIDGERLVDLCVQHALGVEFKPAFSPDRMARQIGLQAALATTTTSSSPAAGAGSSNPEPGMESWTVAISLNDVRARILPVPPQVLEQVPEPGERLVVWVDGEEQELRINRSRRYVGGVTALFRRAGLLGEDGASHCGLATWHFDPRSRKARVEISRAPSVSGALEGVLGSGGGS